MTDPRIEAAARTDYELETGFSWGDLPAGPERELRLGRAAAVVEAADAADDRIRLTLPEYNSIGAGAVYDLGRDLRRCFDDAQYAEVEYAGVFALVEQQAASLSDRFVEPPNVHEAMASLIQERVAGELTRIAAHLDGASLSDVAPEVEALPAERTARVRRRVVNGCADWLRGRALELRTGRTRLYARVDTGLAVDEDRLTALLNAVQAEIDRAELMERDTSGAIPAYILADRLRDAVDAVTPVERGRS